MGREKSARAACNAQGVFRENQLSDTEPKKKKTSTAGGASENSENVTWPNIRWIF
jgi:hypothetical protein